MRKVHNDNHNRNSGAFRGNAPLFLLCVAAITGCRIVAPKSEGDVKIHSERDYAVNSEQMRLRMRALVQPLTGEIIASADQIMAGTTNIAIRRQALVWKIDAVPALREALFQPNPKTAIGDAWVMSIQMKDYFAKGPGKARFGEAHGIAVNTCQHLETELARIAASLTISGDVSKAQDFARRWAAEHPIQDSIASRQSILNRATEKEMAGSFTTREVVASAAVTLDDLNRHLEIYSAQLVEQARWQAELFALDMTGQFQVENMLLLIERSLAMLEKSPALVAGEREAAIAAIHTELARTMTFVQDERIAALNYLSAERIALVQDMRETVVQENKALTPELSGMSSKMVDRAFVRAMQLCAAILVAAFAGLLALLFFFRRMFFPGTPKGPDRQP